jgi:phage baseplate assembly protein W
MAYGISPALPLTVSYTDGPYGLTKAAPEAIIQNFKNLVLTNPGERVMDAEFGVGIREYLFEQQNSMIYEEIQTRLSEQVGKYMPSIKIVGVVFNDSPDINISRADLIDQNILYVKIVFRIVPMNITAALLLPISTGIV